MRLVIICLALACALACGDEGPTSVAPSRTPATPGPPPAQSSTPFRANGTVVEINAGPVADAVVSFVHCSDRSELGRTLTDAAGGFAVEVQSQSRPCLRVQKEGYVPLAPYFNGPIEGVTLRMQRLRQTTGTVFEVDGGPVAGVKVSASGAATFTNANGSFSLGEVGGWLSLSAAGYVSNAVMVPEGQDIALETVRIQREILISGETSLAARISSDDVNYDLWDERNWCTCKWITLDTGGRKLNVSLNWSGESPLFLLAAEEGYGPYTAATGKPGEAAVSILVSAATRYLVVGLRNKASVFQPPLPHTVPPIAFELTTNVP
jgi:hypothetical protein